MKYFQSVALLMLIIKLNAQQTDFLVKPYLQIGEKPSANSMQLLWHTMDLNSTWVAEYKNNNSGDWIKAANPSITKIAVAGHDAFWIYSTSFTSLTPGSLFAYRVLKNGNIIFTAEAKALKTADQFYRVAISGDMATGSKQSGRIANGIYNSNPDLVAIAGDIVYSRGLIAEYKAKYWPVYNADKVDSFSVPLLRSIPVVAAVGNHDLLTRDLDQFPGSLAYYHFWQQPLNGPDGKEGDALVPVLKASDANRKAFLDGAGEKYPRMSNFSFDYGNAHWTVLDSNPYVEWNDSLLKDWVIKDLATAQNATWRFVLLHHPGFNSSRAHYEQQQMRLLSPIFEKGDVDIVFAGHVHNYQRSFPMTFKPDNLGNQLVAGASNIKTGRIVNGQWILDKDFNGNGKTKPKGVIYIVTGAGGQGLYNPEQTTDKDSWQKFTYKFFSILHSFTVMDVKGNTLILRQVDINGKEVDKMKITK